MEKEDEPYEEEDFALVRALVYVGVFYLGIGAGIVLALHAFL